MIDCAVHFRFWSDDNACESSIRGELDKAGIHLVTFHAGNSRSIGIVCFDSIDSGLLNLLHTSREQGGTRILALATSESVLERGVAWRLLHAGASDVLAWHGGATINQIVGRLARWREVGRLANEILTTEAFAGDSSAWQSLMMRVIEAGRFSDLPVLLLGESGTGKELLARILHHASSHKDTLRKRAELVTVDCSAIVPDLSGSELFGHEKGAFTGAHALREGAFALADGATLFLDEVGELPLAMQAQLLRAIQEKTYKRVGGNVWFATNFRLVCATNRNLEDLVHRGEFRLDLYHRIAGWVFHTVNLADRQADVLPLARHFLERIFPDEPPELDPLVCEYLLQRSYAGNIRELRQLIERMAHSHAGPGPISVGDIPEEDRPQDGNVAAVWPNERLERCIGEAIALGTTLREINAATSTAAVRLAVQLEQGNLQRAAKRLGVTDRALQLRRASGMFDA